MTCDELALTTTGWPAHSNWHFSLPGWPAWLWPQVIRRGNVPHCSRPANIKGKLSCQFLWQKKELSKTEIHQQTAAPCVFLLVCFSEWIHNIYADIVWNVPCVCHCVITLFSAHTFDSVFFISVLKIAWRKLERLESSRAQTCFIIFYNRKKGNLQIWTKLSKQSARLRWPPRQGKHRRPPEGGKWLLGTDGDWLRRTLPVIAIQSDNKWSKYCDGGQRETL